MTLARVRVRPRVSATGRPRTTENHPNGAGIRPCPVDRCWRSEPAAVFSKAKRKRKPAGAENDSTLLAARRPELFDVERSVDAYVHLLQIGGGAAPRMEGA